jgi:ribosomal protein S18 acetylase RimI-like enzyme
VEITFVAVDRASVERANALSNELYLLEGLPMDEGRRQAMWELAEHPEFGGAWLILADGSVAGYVVLTACYSLEFHGRFGLLDELYIDERWRGKGLGTAALDFVNGQCRAHGWKSVRLEVAVENLRAQELYRRSGFEAEPRYLLTQWL